MIADPKKKRAGRREASAAARGAKVNSAEYLRQSFLDYFEKAGHKIYPSAPLVPEDPTLLFTAAGMVPFKGFYSHPDSAPHPTAASVQKCLRAGGKQSDLENVGRTLRHHTFFEMLGNFSFGDYFKKEAIEYAWDLSVEVWGFDSKRIWVSVYKDDDEAHRLWGRHVGIPGNRIVRLGKKENFWGPVGETGVCGPSSELYVDTGAERGCGKKTCAPGCDCDRYIEYWNLVFPQFFLTKEGKYEPLPKPGIDTGMGLERVAFVLQGAEDNFHSDLFLPIRRSVENSLPDRSRIEAAAAAINVACDHVRALVFTLSEGIMPSNEGRGYVLRRLLRRALTKMQPFGIRRPFLAEAVDAVVATMSPRYPELRDRAALIREVITAEEERFISTLEQGLGKLREVIDRTHKKKTKSLPGRDVFVLYDTYGFPLELTAELALDEGLDVDRRGFETAMEEQKERARGKSFHVTRPGDTGPAFVEISPVDKTEFLGYDELACDADVGLFRYVKQPEAGVVEAITDRTVFYPEGGGQVGDTGVATFGDTRVEVVDTVRHDDYIVHRLGWENTGGVDATEQVKEFISANPHAHLAVDVARRMSTARNHTATHLLHAALRKFLGRHVVQAGSLVAPDRLRFDFHHYHPMRGEEVVKVERWVNEMVLTNLPVTKVLVSYDEAVAQGAMALFGEKYDDVVRVVSIEEVSKELCAGTHLSRTGEIGMFVIRQESAVAAGVRRIEALTGQGAFQFVKRLMDERASLARHLRVAPDDVEARMRTLVDENEALKKKLSAQESALARNRLEEALQAAETIGGVKLVTLVQDTGDLATLRETGDRLREKMAAGVGLLCLAAKKPVLLIVVSEDLIRAGRLPATQLAAEIGEKFSLKGGGKPHLAQMGIESVEDFKKIELFVKSRLQSRR